MSDAMRKAHRALYRLLRAKRREEGEVWKRKDGWYTKTGGKIKRIPGGDPRIKDREKKEPEGSRKDATTLGPASIARQLTIDEWRPDTKGRQGEVIPSAIFYNGKPQAILQSVQGVGPDGKQRTTYDLHSLDYGKELAADLSTQEDALRKIATTIYARERRLKAKAAPTPEVREKVEENTRRKLITDVTPATRNETQIALLGADPAEVDVTPAKDEPYEFTPGTTKVDLAKLSGEFPDYTDAIPMKVKIVPKKGILERPRPSYIAEIDDATYNRAQGRIEGVKIGEDRYLIAIKDRGVYEKDFAVVSLAVLAASADYYKKRRAALHDEEFKKIREEAQKVNEITIALAKNISAISGERYTPDSEKFEFLRGLLPEKEFEQMAVRAISTVSYVERLLQNDRYANLTEKERGAKRIELTAQQIEQSKEAIEKRYKKMKPKSLSGNRATYSHLNIISAAFQDGHRQRWNYLREYLDDIEQMTIDATLQAEDDLTTFDKGRETSYGKRGSYKTLLDSHGVLIKRQNGKPIDAEETKQLQQALESVYSIFGDRSEMARKDGLLISHSGDKLMHAMKALGVYFPGRKAIGVTWGRGQTNAGFTLAHEFAHYIDNRIGEKGGRHNYASDDRKSHEYSIASTFRQTMRIKQDSKYQNRTCECFARALQQYFAHKTGEAEEYQRQNNSEGNHPDIETFDRDIAPKIEQFLRDRDEILRSMLHRALFEEVRRDMKRKEKIK